MFIRDGYYSEVEDPNEILTGGQVREKEGRLKAGLRAGHLRLEIQ
jgi:hypothetical protein